MADKQYSLCAFPLHSHTATNYFEPCLGLTLLHSLHYSHLHGVKSYVIAHPFQDHECSQYLALTDQMMILQGLSTSV